MQSPRFLQSSRFWWRSSELPFLAPCWASSEMLTGFACLVQQVKMMIFSSSSLILMLEVLFDYVFVEGGRWACSSEFVSIYKKHSWLNMCVLHGFLFIKSCFLWTGLWKRTVTLKNYTGEWSHLASAVKDKSFSVLSQWNLLSSHTQPKWCWFQHWELSENNLVQSPSAQVSVMLTPFSWVALCTKPFRVAAHHQTESLKGISF